MQEINFDYIGGVEQTLILVDDTFSAALSSEIVRRIKGHKALIITDNRVGKLYLDRVMRALKKPDTAVYAFEISAGEVSKSFATVERVLRKLSSLSFDRSDYIINLGGVVSDLGGFAASIYMRGINYFNIPTTLISIIDSSIGGKTGVDFDGVKNSVGSFYQPKLIISALEFLATLPKQEVLSGLGELAKYKFLTGMDFPLSYIETGKLDVDLIASCIKVKCSYVIGDEHDRGRRKLLNLGHTFGHAIEHEARKRGDDIPHGDAVAIGTLLAARLGERIGLSETGLAERLTKDFASVGLPTQCPYPLEALQEAMAKDKKALGGGKVRFVIPVKPGEVVFHEMNPYDLHFDTK